MSEQLSSENAVSVTTQAAAFPEFVSPGDLEWTPWLIEGTFFKLLSVNERTGGYTMIAKVEGGNSAPPHMHIGDAEAYIIEGDMGYGDGLRGKAGDYIREYAGVIHSPDSVAGMTVLLVMHAPIVGYLPDGTIAAVVDARMMYNLAKANGQAAHVKAHFEYMN